MEKVVIFGSTGNTGICAVEAAVKKGLNVRAFLRDPSKLPDHLRNSVEVVQGNVLNYKDVLNAIKNVTAVVVVLGTRNDLKATTDMSEGLKNIIQAMKELNVEILSVCLSAFLFRKPEDVPAIFKDINADHQRMLDLLKASNLKYIAVFPPHIAGDIFFGDCIYTSVKGNPYKTFNHRLFVKLCDNLTTFYLHDGRVSPNEPGIDYCVKHDESPGGRAISKWDLGRFLVDCLSQPEHYGKVVGICTKSNQ